MVEGIFNPFEEPKPKKIPAQDLSFGEDPIVPPVVTLDVGSYVIKLRNAKVEEVADRMGRIIKDIQDKHPGRLLHTGINLIPRGDTYQLDAEEVQLPTSEGYLCVFVGDLKDRPEELENEAFKRIAHAINTVNDPDLQKEHGVTVIRR